MRRATRGAVLLPLLFAFPTPGEAAPLQDPAEAGARIHRSIPPPGAKTHRVVPGERYRAVAFKRWLYGSSYRDLWSTPIEVAVLDLDTVGGGLTPLRAGGFGQSVNLNFTGRDGRRYTVRSLDKDAGRRIWEPLRDTIVDEVLQDLISAMLPTGALVADALMEAAGVLHAAHTPVVIPDDPRLGEFRERFAGLIGMLQEHPSEGPGDTPGFAGSRKVSSTENLLDDLEDGPCDRVDARAFLRARLLDFLVNDKDRHHGQWRWARFPDGDCHTWLPIPEDRDQAFIHFEGVSMIAARILYPIQIPFDGSYPSLVGLTMTGWELDRELLVELDRAAWEAEAAALRDDLPDSVLADAVRRLPPPYYESVGEDLAAALRARRDALPGFAVRYYELISRQAEIKATDRDEVLRCEHLPDGALRVSIGLAEESGGSAAEPWFRRTFRPDETREVRVFLRGGDDRAEVTGEAGRIVVRIDGGGGDDTFRNAAALGGAGIEFYDSRGENRFDLGRGALVEERPYERPPGSHTPNARYALDWGMQPLTFPVVLANPDLGLFARFLHSRQYFGYRRAPFASKHTFSAGLATNGFEPFLSYTGEFRGAVGGLDARLHLDYSGIEMVRFNGLGNDTQLSESSSFYKVEQDTLLFAPAIEFRKETHPGGDRPDAAAPSLRSDLVVRVGPALRYSDTPAEANETRYLGSLAEPLYGAGSFGQIGVRGEALYDTRDDPGYATRGVFLRLGGAVYPRLWDVESAFGTVGGEGSTYLTARIPTEPTLALRAGGKKVWGDFPFHESAFVGGPGFASLGTTEGGTVRGYRQHRFSGDASLYANAELRFSLLDFEFLMPMEWGVFGAVDTGRVFFADDPPGADRWHTGIGGGVWLGILERRSTVSLAVMRSEELTGFYLRAGLLF